MSKGIKTVTSALGMGSSSSQVTAANINKAPFQIDAEAKRLQGYVNPMVQSQVARQASTGQAFDQANIAQNLAQTASGQGPSLAQAQLKSAQDRNLAQLMAAQSAARNVSGGAAARNLALASTQGNRQVAQDAASAKILEQRQAQQDLMGLRQAEDASALDLAQTAFNADTAAKREMQQAELQQFGANQQAASQANQARIDRNSQTRQMGSQALSALLMSDKNVKSDVEKETKKIDKFLDAMKSYSFEYKKGTPNTSSGKKVGVMAQDLEKSEIGKSLVKQTNAGKAIDMKNAFSAIMASQARLNERMKSLEKGKKKS